MKLKSDLDHILKKTHSTNSWYTYMTKYLACLFKVNSFGFWTCSDKVNISWIPLQRLRIAPYDLFQFRSSSEFDNSFRHLVGLLGQEISPSQGIYLQKTAQHRRELANMYALSGVWTHDPNVRAIKAHATRQHSHCGQNFMNYKCKKTVTVQRNSFYFDKVSEQWHFINLYRSVAVLFINSVQQPLSAVN